MTRLAMALALWIGIVAQTPASLTPRKDTQRLSGAFATADSLGRVMRGVQPQRGDRDDATSTPKSGPARSAQSADPPPPGTGSDYVLTTRTEVFLDGKPCKYEKVPAGASITLMEVARDHKTVLKVYFRSAK
jgi:hypothetical protein